MQKHENFHGNENALFGKLIIHLIKDSQHIQQMRNQAESLVGVPNCDREDSIPTICSCNEIQLLAFW